MGNTLARRYANWAVHGYSPSFECPFGVFCNGSNLPHSPGFGNRSVLMPVCVKAWSFCDSVEYYSNTKYILDFWAPLYTKLVSQSKNRKHNVPRQIIEFIRIDREIGDPVP